MELKDATFKNFPEWQKATAKKVEMQLELHRLETQLANADHRPAHNKLEMAAKALLAGEGIPKMREPVPDTELEEKLHRVHVLRRAIELHAGEIQHLESSLSREICTELKPQYRAIIADVLAALHTLYVATAKEQDFRRALIEENIALGAVIQPIPCKSLGDVGDVNSFIRRFYSEAQECYGVKHKALDDLIKTADQRARVSAMQEEEIRTRQADEQKKQDAAQREESRKARAARHARR